MKYFIVNVKNCLPMSQYAPFFYEHIYNGGNVEFNLLDGKVCMKASRTGTIEYVPKFSRKVRATSN